jgi:hypothetical protein
MDSTILAAIIGAAATIIAAALALRNRGKKSTERNDIQINRSSTRLVHFFLAGCAVGNRIALLPLPPGSDPHAVVLTEFIDSLRNIGLRGKQLEPFIEAREILPSPSTSHVVLKTVVERYFEAMKGVTADVRAIGSTEEFRWFKLGDLLYENITTRAVEQEGADESNPGITSGTTAVDALESLIENMELPTTIRESVRQYISSTRAGEDPDRLMVTANDIARVIYSLL